MQGLFLCLRGRDDEGKVAYRRGIKTLLEGVLALLACQEGALPICIAHEQEQRIVQQVTEAVVSALQKSYAVFISAAASEKHLQGTTHEHSVSENGPEPDKDSSTEKM